MNKVWMIAAAGTMFAGGLFAQMGGEEEEGAGSYATMYMELLDVNADGKITKEEIKKASDRDSEGENARSKLETYGSYLSTFLVADADENNEVTKDELTTYFQTAFDGKKSKLSAKAMETMDKEYISPWIDQLWADADADKDGNLTAAEMEKLGEGESAGFETYDTNSDGKLSKAEIRKVFEDAMKETYEVEPSKGTDTDPKGTDPKGTDPKGTDNDPKGTDTDPKGAGNIPELYKKVGRSWTWKSTANYAGTEMVSYIKYEVLEVGDTWVKVKMTTMDKDKKEYPGMAPTETKMDFGSGSGSGGAAVDMKTLADETVKVEAGEFECKVTEVEVSGNKTKSWMSKKFDGLVVKTASESSMGKSSMELVEFKE
jgi:Ca2+-binding EF-hand superfamily protein